MEKVWAEIRKVALPLVAFTIGEGNQLSGATIPWLSGSLFIIAGVLAVIYVWPHVRVFRPFSGFEFQWPIRHRGSSWPQSASLTTRLYCARCLVHFDELQTKNIIKLTLQFFNASYEPVLVDSVDGHLRYGTGIGSLTYPPIGWPGGLQKREPKAPFDEISIDLEQPVPPAAIPLLLAQFQNGGRLSIELHLRIMAVAMNSNTRFQLITWQGVSCKIQPNPVVEGKLVFVTAKANVETQATQLAP
jgi:hypothetical protein